MNKEELQERTLRNTVRIQLKGKTIGSGMLHVPVEGDKAYVLTVAHVFNKEEYPVQIQCYPDGADDGSYTIDVEKTEVHTLKKYDSKLDKSIVQYCDAAVVEIPKRQWMTERACVYFGFPRNHLPVLGYGYSGSTRETDIREDNVLIEDTKIRDVMIDCHRMRMHLKGDFELNHADREGEIGGLSGTILVAQGQHDIVAVGALCNTNVENASLSMVNVIDMTAFCEIFEKIGAGLERYEIQPEEAERKRLVPFMTGADRHFVYRNEEIDAIRDALRQENLIVLYGMGGIGKTELARYYAAKCRAEYTCVQEVSCTKSILEGIAEQVKVTGISRRRKGNDFETNEEYGQRLLDWILEQPSQYLFIFDDVSPKDPAWPQIASMNQDKIVTSRWNQDAWNCRVREITALKDAKEQRSLFEQYLDRNLEEQEIPVFEKIADIVNGHTLTLQLIALQCNAADAALEDMLTLLKNQGIYTEDENDFSYGNTQEERNMYGHIRAIWNFSTLNQIEGRIMQGLCLLPERGITKTEYKTWMRLESLNVINSLQKRGWIQAYHQEGKTWIYLHMVISEVVYWELYRKEPAELQELQWEVFEALKNRSQRFTERLRYISYGEYMGRRLPSSIETVYFLLGLSMEEEYLRNLEKAMNILKQAEAYLKELNAMDTLAAADCYNNIAVVYQTGYDHLNARKYYEKACDVYERYESEVPEKYGFALHNIARIYLTQEDYNKVLQLENKAEVLIRKGNKYRLGNIYDVRANYYAHKMEEAIEAYQQDPMNEKLKEKVWYYLKCEWRHWDLAVKYKEEYCPELKSEIILSKASRACSAAFIGKYEEAKQEIQEALEFNRLTTGEESIEVGNTYSKMCLVYEKCGEYEAACQYGEMAVDILKEHGERCRPDLDVAERNLKIAQERTGNPQI